MRTTENALLRRCIESLEQLPFVEEATLVAEEKGHPFHMDGKVRLLTPTGAQELYVEAKHTNLTRTIVDGVLARMARPGAKPWILFAPHVGKHLAAYLDDQNANFVDPAGNCRLQLGDGYIAKIEGRPPPRLPAKGRGVGASGIKIAFALLVQPGLLNRPVRLLAEAAGVAPATAADRLARLREERLIHGQGQQAKLVSPHRLQELWLKGYETLLRPKLLIGTYRIQVVDPEETEHVIEQALGDDMQWGYGAASAAYRLTGFYRGEETVVHVGNGGFDYPRRLRALRTENGPITLLKAPGRLAFRNGLPRTVVPQLVYAELLIASNKRAREAAIELQRAYPEEIL